MRDVLGMAVEGQQAASWGHLRRLRSRVNTACSPAVRVPNRYVCGDAGWPVCVPASDPPLLHLETASLLVLWSWTGSDHMKVQPVVTVVTL